MTPRLPGTTDTTFLADVFLSDDQRATAAANMVKWGAADLLACLELEGFA